jgi:predicted dehydrogenase
MKQTTRRTFLRSSITAGLALGLPKMVRGAERSSRVIGANDAIRLAVIGLGATTAVGGVGGRGHQLIARLREVPNARIATLCDVDQTHLDREAQPFKDRNEEITTCHDLRRVFDDKTIDAVVIALPNHWHALATVWACQAGKDVYVEKPFSYDLWEGQQMVTATRKYGRMIQVGTQNRSSTLLCKVFDDLRRGELGSLRYGHTLVYRARDGIGTVSSPTTLPATVDYDLWCGPAPKTPLMRKQLHYEWHWFWATGNGEMGNNGIHVMDLCRWALGQNQPPPRALSIGGRFAFNDCGETANTHIALLDYQPAPLICEVRNVRAAKSPDAMGKFRNRSGGLVIDCEGGYFAGDAAGGAFFDKQGKKIRDITDDGSGKKLEVLHLSNFLAAVRNRKSSELACEALEGHRSAACCHMANISHRLGKQASPEAIRATTQASGEMADAFDRCRAYLRENGVDLGTTPATLGPWVTYNAKQEKFVRDFAEQANALSKRDYRKPYVLPKLA